MLMKFYEIYYIVFTFELKKFSFCAYETLLFGYMAYLSDKMGVPLSHGKCAPNYKKLVFFFNLVSE